MPPRLDIDCLALATAFYTRVETDPLLRPLFPGSNLRCATEALAAFLNQILGGPPADSQFRWHLSLRESHHRFRIGEAERAAWMSHMNGVLAAGPEELRVFFEQGSHYLAAGRSPELSPLWTPQLALEKAVEAVAAGDAPEAIRQAAHCAPVMLPGLLARMVASHQPELLEFVHHRIRTVPALVTERYAGRTLLHSAASAGSLETVRLLLAAGADPNALDGGRHTPLYSLANECRSPEGPAVVRCLVSSGARVEAAEGVQRCTPLHMAARRGFTEIAAALIESGANPRARDRRGDTPLQRALNCRQGETARFLASVLQ